LIASWGGFGRPDRQVFNFERDDTMATEILAIGTTAANSSDVVIASGDQLTVSLKDAAGTIIAGSARVEIQIKDDAGQYFAIATLTGARPALVITGAGTYRFSRAAGGSCGVFSA
jgi:hypothetical protein